MKWLRTIVIFDTGNLVSSVDWKIIHDSYVRAIGNIDHPKASGKLTLREKRKLINGQWSRNGVNYLKSYFLDLMTNQEKWKNEGNVDIERDKLRSVLQLYPSQEKYCEPITSEFGNFDFVTIANNGTRVAIEWETGNISSSHRSMNKLSIALSSGVIDAGVLIVPSRDLYQHLTDRIGNIGELSGYLVMWKALGKIVESGLLAITVVEHDALTVDSGFPYLPMGRDGRAREGRAKLREKR